MALLALGFLPLAILHLVALWAGPWHRWLPVALVAALALAARALHEPRQPATPGRPWAWWPLLGLGLAGLAAAAWWRSPWLGWLGGLLAWAGTLGWAGGWRLLRRWLPAWVMGLTLLSLPHGWDAVVVERVESLVLLSADRMLYSWSVPHLLSPLGVTLTSLTVPRETLFTGLYGVPGVLVAGLGWLLWQRRHPVRVLATLGWAALFPLPLEVVRIAWGLAACDARQANSFTTPLATWLVIGTWLLEFLLLLSADQGLRFLTAPRRRPDLPPATSDDSIWPGALAAMGLHGPPMSVAWAGAVAALVLGGVGVSRAWPDLRAVPPTGAAVAKPERTFTLAEWPGWLDLAASNSLAQVELLDAGRASWYRQKGDFAVSVSVAGPFPRRITPLPQYQARGWNLSGWVPVAAQSGGPPACATADLLRDQVFHGVLWFGLVDESGRWLDLPGRLRAPRPEPWLDRPCYLVQVLATSPRYHTPAERADVREKFEAARAELARQLAPAPEARP